MSRTDKSALKSQSARPYSAQALSTQCPKKEAEKPDLRLTGSQIHLTCRPKLGCGRTSSRSMSVSSIRSKRPMSAMPAFGHQGICGTRVADIARWKRPQSADNSYFPGGDHSLPSSAASECDETLDSNPQKECDVVRRRSKLAAKFPLLSQNIDNCVTNAKHTDDIQDTDFNHGFGATYTLTSSQLLENLTSEPLGRTWTESELKECCEELGIENIYFNKFENDSLGSDCSNGVCHSEKSLGQQIIAMAQEPQPKDLTCKLALKPGLSSKPPLPLNNRQETGRLEKHVNSNGNFDDINDNDVLFEKLTQKCSVVDKSPLPNLSAHSLDQFIQILDEPSGNNNRTYIVKNVASHCLSDKNGMTQTNLVNNLQEDMMQQCLYSNNLSTNTQCLSGNDSLLVLENEKDNFTKSSHDEAHHQSADSRHQTSNITDVSHNLAAIKVQHWFPDSHLSEAERQTDMLLENLVQEQCNYDCSNSCDGFSIKGRQHDGIESIYFDKQRKQELYLECLVEEDVDEHNNSPSSIRSKDNGKKCSSCHDDSMETSRQSNIPVLHMSATNDAPKLKSITDKRTEAETNDVLIDVSYIGGNSEENSNDPYICCVGKPGENNKSEDVISNSCFASADEKTVTHWLKTQQNRDDLHISADSSNQFYLEPISAHENKVIFPSVSSQFRNSDLYKHTEHDIPENNKMSLPLEQRGVGPLSPSVTSLPLQTYDLNISTVEPSGNSTYDDIVTILKVLEQEESYSLLKLDGLKLTPNTEILSSENLINTSLLDNTHNIPATSGKLRDILTYLDEVEHCCDVTLESAKNQLQVVKEATRNSELKLTTMPRLEELLNSSTVDLAHEVLTLRLQLEERSNSINLLQETLNQQRELTVRNTKNADRDMKMRLREQKDEYEAAVARHQKFIDQLIADKKTLSDKCETLVLELKKCEDHYSNNLKAVEERHSIELQRAREMHAAAEKLRRERWIDNKTQKIKEMTVKGLEPELQRMNTRHQQELGDLRLLHKQELDELDLRATRKTSQQMEQLRDQLTAEKEEALVKEKELLRQRIEKQAEQEELEYQAQRRRFLAEIRREKERLAEEEARVKQELEETKQNLSRENTKVVEKLKQEHQETMDTCIRRHQNEMKSLKEALEIEKDTWMHSYKRDQATRVSEKESKIRDQYKRERDKEIELVIERLESEATQSRAEVEQTMDNRLRRLKEKYDAEIKDFEVSEKALKAKYNETKSKLVEKEDEVINLKANTRQLEKELEEAKKIVDRLSGERAEIKEIVRKEFVSHISGAEEDNIRLREEMAELRTRHKLELSSKGEEIARIISDKERQLQQVYNRVKLAVTKKDETIQKLRLQHDSALERCCHLEELLEQQRRDFLLK